jgi:DNA-binding transcriptional regulator YiaG
MNLKRTLSTLNSKDGEITNMIDSARKDLSSFNALVLKVQEVKEKTYGNTFSVKSAWITAARLLEDMTMAQFAERIGVYLPTLQSWELDARSPKIDKLLRYAMSKGLPSDLLLK